MSIFMTLTVHYSLPLQVIRAGFCTVSHLFLGRPESIMCCTIAQRFSKDMWDVVFGTPFCSTYFLSSVQAGVSGRRSTYCPPATCVQIWSWQLSQVASMSVLKKRDFSISPTASLSINFYSSWSDSIAITTDLHLKIGHCWDDNM